ncbi:MAG: hypothetical protein IJ769_12555 [Clostridia bacterium]|nr:hypothetical protein [Clostridia bacterium]
MRFSENRTIAFIVLAVCVLVSVFGLGGMGLARERGRVLTVYDRGTDASLSTRHSMDAYLDAAAESAQLMVSEAQLHMDASATIETVAQLSENVAEQADTNARYEAYSALKTAVDKLYNAMYDAAKGDAFTNFKMAYDDFWGYDDMIRHDDYGKLAAGYNSLISGFPGSIVAGVTGQSALNTFGG